MRISVRSTASSSSSILSGCNGLETTSCHFVKDPSNNINKCPERTPASPHVLSQFVNIRFSFAKALCVWEKERATQSLQRLWDYAAFSSVVFFFRTSASVWGLIRWTCCCVLQPWSDLPDRWLGDIKSLLSAGAGPESGGGDGWMDGWTWRGGVCARACCMCWWL